MTTMTDTTFNIGDRVTIDHPKAHGIFTVTQKLPKNYRVTPVGGGAPIRVSPELLQHAPDGNAPGVEVLPMPVFLDCGQLVTMRGKTGLYVVLKSTQRGYSVAKLGGDAGRYWNAPTASLTLVPADKLADALLDHAATLAG